MKIISLRQGRLSAKIAPEYGSNLISWKTGKRELIYTDFTLLKKRDFTGCFVLWPFPNRVRNREYVFGGKRYSLKEVLVPRGNYPLIHGLVQDQKWQYKKISASEAKTWVEIDKQFRYWQNWPFKSRLTLTYKLVKTGLKIEYQVENLGRKILGFGFALHPYFFQAKRIMIPAKFVMEADKELLPSGKLSAVDWRTPRSVEELSLDDVFIGLNKPVEIYFAKHKVIVKTSADFTHCVVYTKEKPKFVCVEPQTCSTDAFNLDSLGFKKEAHLIRVRPGRSCRGEVHYCLNRVPP